jgi:enterochelin esterase-like enzyme
MVRTTFAFVYPLFLFVALFATSDVHGQTVEFRPEKHFLLAGERLQPNIVVNNGYDMEDLEFKSSYTGILEVDDAGRVTAVSPGYAYVYAKGRDDETVGDNCLIVVRNDASSTILEAEAARLRDQAEILSSNSASKKQFINLTREASADSLPDTEHAVFSFNLDHDGLFIPRFRLKTEEDEASFWFKIDDGEWKKISGITRGWDEYSEEFALDFCGTYHFGLKEGSHTIKVAGDNAGIHLDYVRLIEDSTSLSGYRAHYSKTFGEDRWYNIFLPSYYHSTGKKFPVIYYFHGWGGRVFREGQPGPNINYHEIEERVEQDSVIFVMADGQILWDGGSDITNYYPYNFIEVKHDLLYENYFPELVRHIDSHYRTLRKRSKRVVCGYSMGGGMTYRLGERYPHLIGTIQTFCASANARIGNQTQTYEGLFYLMMQNLHGVNARIHETTEDYLKKANLNMYHAGERQKLDNLNYEEYPGPHTMDLPGSTKAFSDAFDFMLKSLENPLQQPEKWHYTDFNPRFEVWDYKVQSTMGTEGFIALKGVNRAGMEITTKKWLPYGPELKEETINVTTAPVYKENVSYNLFIYDQTSDSSHIRKARSNDEGRISFSVNSHANHIGIYGNDEPPELVFLAHKTNGSGKFIQQGEKENLRIRILNKGGTKAEQTRLSITTQQEGVTLEDSIITLAGLDAGSSTWIEQPFTVKAGFDPPEYRSYSDIRFNLEMVNSQRKWKDAFNVPVFFDVPAFEQFTVVDNKSYGKTNNGNGIPEPGELIGIRVKDKMLRLFCDEAHIVDEKEQRIFTSAPKNGKESYSLVKISEECPPGTRLEFLARKEHYVPDLETVRYEWGKTEITVQPDTLDDSSE